MPKDGNEVDKKSSKTDAHKKREDKKKEKEEKKKEKANKRKDKDDQSSSDKTASKASLKSVDRVPSEERVRVKKSGEIQLPVKQPTSRMRRNFERLEILARPNSRLLRCLWDEKCAQLPKERRDKIKSFLEEDYFLSPEQTEQYFQAMSEHSKRWPGPGSNISRQEANERARELRQRQKWLVNFSAQVAYRMCDYIAKGQKEMLVTNRLRSIADVVLERVAEILGQPKPSRNHPGRLPRFMVAISDRIAVWIENAVYRADAIEPREAVSFDEHIRLDSDKNAVR